MLGKGGDPAGSQSQGLSTIRGKHAVIQVLWAVEVILHNTIKNSFMNDARFHVQEAKLEE
jgi:hypothetical protein